MNRKIKGENVLVTGGAGFIGSHLVDRLIREGAGQVVVIDNMFLGDELNLQDAFAHGVVLYKDDAEIASSLEYVIDKHDIDVVFNCATKALNYSFINPSNACDTNIKVIMNLLELQRKKAFGTLCHFSSSEVFGTAVYEPMDEDHPMHPTTTYAAGKAAADIILQSYARMFQIDAFIVRPFNNYGPRQNYQGPLAGVIPITVSRIVQNRPPEIHGNGNQSRDFIHVLDTVDTVMKLYPVMKAGESVNISVTNQIKIKELIHRIAELMEYRGKIILKKARKSDVHCHIGSNKKLRKLIDFQTTPFDKGLRTTIDWYKNRFLNTARDGLR